MQKSLIILALLAAPKADLSLHGTEIILNECGHAQEMLHTPYNIHFTKDGIKVNYTKWQVVLDTDQTLWLDYKADPQALTEIGLVYFKDIKQGYIEVVGQTENRNRCIDRIEIE